MALAIPTGVCNLPSLLSCHAQFLKGTGLLSCGLFLVLGPSGCFLVALLLVSEAIQMPLPFPAPQEMVALCPVGDASFNSVSKEIPEISLLYLKGFVSFCLAQNSPVWVEKLLSSCELL